MTNESRGIAFELIINIFSTHSESGQKSVAETCSQKPFGGILGCSVSS